MSTSEVMSPHPVIACCSMQGPPSLIIDLSMYILSQSDNIPGIDTKEQSCIITDKQLIMMASEAHSGMPCIQRFVGIKNQISHIFIDI